MLNDKKLTQEGGDNSTNLQGGNITVNQGVPLEKYDEKVLALGETRYKLQELEGQHNQLSARYEQISEKYEHSESRIKELTQQLEGERDKGLKDDDLKQKLRDLDQKRDFPAAKNLVRTEIYEKKKMELAAAAFQMGGYAELELKFEEAKAAYKEAVELHPEEPIYLSSLGVSYKISGEYIKALQCHEKALKIILTSNVNDPFYEATQYVHIGMCHGELGQHEIAINNFKIALDKIDTNNEGGLFLYCSIQNNLGVTYIYLEEFEKAISCFLNVEKIYKEILEESDPAYAAFYSNLGIAYDNSANKEEALKCFEKSLKIARHNYGNSHPHVGTILTNMGRLYLTLGRNEEALSFVKECLVIDEKIYGLNSHQRAITLLNLSRFYSANNQFQIALPYAVEAHDIDSSILPSNHPTISLLKGELGSIYFGLKDYEKAVEYLQQSLDINLPDTIPNNKHIANKLFLLGRAYVETSKYTTALHALHKAHELQKKLLGELDLDTIETEVLLCIIYIHFKNRLETERILKSLISKTTQLPDTPDLIGLKKWLQHANDSITGRSKQLPFNILNRRKPIRK